MTGTESTPEQTVVDKRWDGREDERKTYDFIFNVALAMTRDPEHSSMGELLFFIINDWEKNPRLVPQYLIQATFKVAEGYAPFMDIDSALRELMKKEGDGAPG